VINEKKMRGLWAGRRLPEQSCDKRLGIEVLEVIGSFSYTDEAQGELQFFCNGDDNPPSCSPIELRQSKSCNSSGLVKLASLSQRVLPNRGIQDQQHFMWCTGQFLADHPFDLPQLVHQIGLGVQATRRVDEDHVHHPGFGCNDTVEGHSSWIGTMSLANDLHSHPIPPHLKLINSGCTKGISSDKKRSPPALHHPLCNFRDGGCLSNAVDSNDKGDKRLRAFSDQLIDRWA
jgi:hypothetical protein